MLPADAPDPDAWVRRREASALPGSGRVVQYPLGTAILVVDVSDSSEYDDLHVMAEMYAAAKVPVYWVVTHQGVWVHTRPDSNQRAYRSRTMVPREGELQVPERPFSIPVVDLYEDAD